MCRYDWSKLCFDIVRSIFEGLDTKDYHRARTVCSNWYSASTTCKRPLYPWQIVLYENCISLYDPGEKKFQRVIHPDTSFEDIIVLASCCNWLLVVDSRPNFYLLNVFTREKINLPSIECSLLDKWDHYTERTGIISSRKPAVLWINERTRDYVVAWNYKQNYLFSYKNGDDSWCKLEGTQCADLTYKDNKLYVLTKDLYIKILDISSDSLKEVVEGNPYRNPIVMQHGENMWMSSIAIRQSGEILITVSLKVAEKRARL